MVPKTLIFEFGRFDPHHLPASPQWYGQPRALQLQPARRACSVESCAPMEADPLNSSTRPLSHKGLADIAEQSLTDKTLSCEHGNLGPSTGSTIVEPTCKSAR